MERAKGIEPSSQAWEARILPMNYARMMYNIVSYISLFIQVKLIIPYIPIVVIVLCYY